MVFRWLLLVGFSAIRIFLCQLNENCSKTTSHCVLATWMQCTVVFLLSSVFVLRIIEDAVTSVLLTGAVAIFLKLGVVKLARGNW